MQDPIDPIFDLLGITGSSVLVTLVVISLVCNLIGRIIPDDAVGPLGLIRKIAKIVGLYASNRVSAGVNVNQIAKAVIGVPTKERVESMVEQSLEAQTGPNPGRGLFPGYRPEIARQGEQE